MGLDPPTLTVPSTSGYIWVSAVHRKSIQPSANIYHYPTLCTYHTAATDFQLSLSLRCYLSLRTDTHAQLRPGLNSACHTLSKEFLYCFLQWLHHAIFPPTANSILILFIANFWLWRCLVEVGSNLSQICCWNINHSVHLLCDWKPNALLRWLVVWSDKKLNLKVFETI